VDTLLFLGYFARVITVRALYVLGFWFILQLFNAVLSLGGSGGGIAYFAHIGGFVAGLAVLGVLRLLRRQAA
jgi:membrane associated rhomboid family serine protease